jgi:hypothetical protein
MTKIRSVLQLMLAFIIASAFFSCGGSATKSTGDTTAHDSTIAAKTAAPAALAAPFDMAEITHTVKDYARWRPDFDADSTDRKETGMQTLAVGRGIDSANRVVIALKLSDVTKAKAFVAAPKLKYIMAKAGVSSKPDVKFFHVIRFNPNSHEKQWVLVTHKVKDFDAWVKVYDGEGTAKRASEGMVDVVLARGIDDPNLIQIVFDITDMAKAKAAIFSDEKKKLMMSAGVTGAPLIQFYTDTTL